MTAAIIVAAGRGTRMGPSVDKIFLEVAGKPIVVHAWERFAAHPMIDQIVLVVKDGFQSAFHDLAKQFPSHLSRKPYSIVIGGSERQHSVWNGLQALDSKVELVAIQDGARPCTSSILISQILLAAQEMGAAVAAQRATDTVKQSDDGRTITHHLDRSHLWTVQTPQAFRVEVIRKALRFVMEQNLTVTDDTAACAFIEQPVRLVESTSPNPKATAPSDLPILESLLAQL